MREIPHPEKTYWGPSIKGFQNRHQNTVTREVMRQRSDKHVTTHWFVDFA